VFAGVVIAAVVCAGCVGWSFVSHKVIGKSPYGASVPSSGQHSPTTAAPSAPSSR
jgi:hypothetical protein